MSKDEFVALWGDRVWERLVAPLQASACRCSHCDVRRRNANFLTHASLEEARKRNSACPEKRGMPS